MKRILFGIFACLLTAAFTAQASDILPFDVAKTDPEINQLAATTDDQLDQHITQIGVDDLIEQVSYVNDGKHVILLQRLLNSIRRLIREWEPSRSTAVVTGINNANPNIYISYDSTGATTGEVSGISTAAQSGVNTEILPDIPLPISSRAKR